MTASGTETRSGPLAGLTIIEMAGLGPVPLAGLMLAEMGARVVRIERLAKEQAFLNLPPEFDLDRHGREILRIDLKHLDGLALVKDLIARADVLIEGFRPGVMERLGLGPDEALNANSRLIYGRMTGFGQEGPLAMRAGHDLTYLALTGALHAIGPEGGKPVPPLNLVADYGGGTMLLINGILAALISRGTTGRGQIVDAAMVDGAAMLAAPYHAFTAAGIWSETRGQNLLDSGTPFYDTYECADGKYIAIACLEPQFFATFCRLLPLPESYVARQYDRSLWAQMRSAIEMTVNTRTRDDWAHHFEESDACVAPVLTFAEAAQHPHAMARDAYVTVGPLRRPAPAPRFSRTHVQVAYEAVRDPLVTLDKFGMEPATVHRLIEQGILGKR